jgi:hypothetical protein
MFQSEHWDDLQRASGLPSVPTGTLGRNALVFPPEHWSEMCLVFQLEPFLLVFQSEHLR